nr:hypothetical protein [Bacillus sp. FJAT-27225]
MLKRLIEAGIVHEGRLSVYTGNQAIKLYEKLGFKKRTITMRMPI